MVYKITYKYKIYTHKFNLSIFRKTFHYTSYCLISFLFKSMLFSIKKKTKKAKPVAEIKQPKEIHANITLKLTNN